MRRHLDDEAVHAGPPDLSYRLRKFCRRHRVAVASTAILALVLFAVTAFGFFWTTWKNHQLDSSNAELLLKNQEYLREKSTSERALQEVERLSDAHLLANLLARADRDLWRAVPEKIASMKTWLTEAKELLGRVDSHRSELRVLRARALPSERSDADADSDTVSFAATKDAWRHDLLSRLVRDLDALGADSGTVASVRKRLAFASELRARSIEQHADAWRRTVEGVVRGGTYPRLAKIGFEPQVGLVPLGPDPDSGLFEFLDLATHAGAIPNRDSNGKLSTADNTGVVLVLIPGGSFFMGAQKDDENAPNFDGLARPNELPVHEQIVDAFFMSKYEMTQAQWMHLENGANPSSYYQGVLVDGQRFTRRHPVERVQWTAGDRVLRKVGMTYPTEAQWEYATRAGTQTPWFFGNGGPRLAEVSNFADVSVVRAAPFRVTNLDDGFRYTAPVGSFDANPFGLHDVCGNVAEWCRDAYRPGYDSKRPLREPLGRKALRSWRRRAVRGGSWSSVPDKVRSAFRHAYSGTMVNHTLGLRPARAIRRKQR